MNSWDEHIRKVVPYVPGEQPLKQGITKLNTNENPYPPAPEVAEAIQAMSVQDFRLYPDPAVKKLTAKLAQYYGLKDSQIFVGVGSDDVLALCFLTFFNSDKPILFPDITYSFYDVWADLFRIPYVRIPLDNHFQIVEEDYFRENGGIIFPNPNAPTGVLKSTAEIENIIKQNLNSIVIIDEAYIDFGGVSALELIESYDNILIVQTFSKSRAMAGMRIGYAMGNERLIQYLSDVKYSFNSYTMNAPSIACGVAALENEEYFKSTIDKIIVTRECTKRKLTELGFRFQDSMANFIFATHSEVNAKDIFEALKQEYIYVRYFNKERIDNYLRITIGTEAEMDTLLAALKKIVNKKRGKSID